MGGIIPTHVEGLDEQIEGGIPEGHLILLCGPTGSMKTTLAYSILHNAKDVNSIYISVEQSRKSLAKQMDAFGMPSDPLETNISMVDTGMLRKKLGFLGDKALTDIVKMFVKMHINETDAKLLVIDSLESFYVLMDMKNPRNDLFHFFNELKNLGLTTIVVSEMMEEQEEFGVHKCEEFLSDGIIYLSNEKVGRSVVRYLRVVKMRAIDHSSDYFPLLVDKNVFRIVTK
ncbi:MAG: AAA family ATPase [Thermoplasmata archaeon]|nr:AAA family ATPase [Thermoplasmata archaeon]MCK5396826.1 AAA family ATPase [Thermoplasmata archaeon]